MKSATLVGRPNAPHGRQQPLGRPSKSNTHKILLRRVFYFFSSFFYKKKKYNYIVVFLKYVPQLIVFKKNYLNEKGKQKHNIIRRKIY